MADENEENRIAKLKNSEIAVRVEEALDDVLIVSFRHQGRVFQGALLDSTKQPLPCGIKAPEDFMKPPPPPPVTSVEADSNGLMHRHTYFQETGEQHAPFSFRTLKTQGSKNQRQPNKKMTVRLRPRKVLCSKCKSTCNPNTAEATPVPASSTSSSNPEPPTRASKRTLKSVEEDFRSVTFKEPQFVLLNESRPDNVDSCSNSSNEDDKSRPEKIKIVGNYWISPSREVEEDAKDPLAMEETDKMVLRKKRSVGSMEDLWDESIFEEGGKRTKFDPLEPTRTTTPIIKISFGSQGQGTVLKIPAKVQTVDNMENSENESDRAVKKAMKKAKKKKMQGSPSSSPTWGEPRRHKHKHLKKHKKSRHREDAAAVAEWNVSQTDEEIKEQCLKQRLSISLKRLNATAYMRCDQDDPTPSSSNSPSPDGSEEVPDFPETDIVGAQQVSEAPEVRVCSQTVQSYVTADGRKMTVGEVVWGKIHGFPWWPGKVLSISITRKEDGVCLSSHAHVSWYGSPTSSWMLSDQLNPFLETFKVRYNKKKRGPYKEAIRQATTEAQQLATVAVPSASPSQLLSVTSSPREVNVLS